MQNLKLRTVGTRHVASDGKNDVGEFDEAHLRAYVASLPGSYEAPKPRSEGATFARQRFAEAVETRKRRLLAEDGSLNQLEAHRTATSQVLKENPSMLAAYRADVQKI